MAKNGNENRKRRQSQAAATGAGTGTGVEAEGNTEAEAESYTRKRKRGKLSQSPIRIPASISSSSSTSTSTSTSRSSSSRRKQNSGRLNKIPIPIPIVDLDPVTTSHKIWEVQKIAGKRGEGAKAEFFVVWKDWALITGTWESKENLADCSEALMEFYNWENNSKSKLCRLPKPKPKPKDELNLSILFMGILSPECRFCTVLTEQDKRNEMETIPSRIRASVLNYSGTALFSGTKYLQENYAHLNPEQVLVLPLDFVVIDFSKLELELELEREDLKQELNYGKKTYRKKKVQGKSGKKLRRGRSASSSSSGSGLTWLVEEDDDEDAGESNSSNSNSNSNSNKCGRVETMRMEMIDDALRENELITRILMPVFMEYPKAEWTSRHQALLSIDIPRRSVTYFDWIVWGSYQDKLRGFVERHPWFRGKQYSFQMHHFCNLSPYRGGCSLVVLHLIKELANFKPIGNTLPTVSQLHQIRKEIDKIQTKIKNSYYTW